MKRLLLVALTLILLPIITGCFSSFVVPDETSGYNRQTATVLDSWKTVQNEWKEIETLETRPWATLDASVMKAVAGKTEVADRLAADMDKVIAAWEKVKPPAKYKEFHEWMRVAMKYDRECYYRLWACYSSWTAMSPAQRNEKLSWVNEAAILKDKALFAARDSVK